MSGDTITTQKVIDYSFTGLCVLGLLIWAVSATWMNLWGKKRGKK